MKWTTYSNPRHKDTLWCDVILQIKRNADGELNEQLTDVCYSPEEGGPSLFYWSEGNFSCDCNRETPFGEDTEDCTYGRYSLRLLHPETREVYYQDGQWD